jgi:ferritin-like protein
MTEALFSINNAGKLISARYYTITQETLKHKLLSEELIEEVIRRVIEQNRKDWNFTFDNMQVEILKKHEYKVDFFVSRDIPIGEGIRYLIQCSSNS